MSAGQLTVHIRNTSGKGAARQLRLTGAVPGVLYGATEKGKVEPTSIAVNVKALKAALDPVRKQNTVITLTVEGEGSPGTLTALLKEFQLDSLRRDITHVDLLAIDPNKEVDADVPFEFIGKPAGAVDGGHLHIVMRSLHVRCKPASIPIKLEVDVSPLKIADALHVSDVKLPAGVVSMTGLGQAVVTCAAPEAEPVAAEVAPDAAAAAAGAAPAAGAPAEAGKDAKGGAAPAAAGAAPAKADAKAAPAKGGDKKK
jgi:large subunit ribosomal protein L25